MPTLKEIEAKISKNLRYRGSDKPVDHKAVDIASEIFVGVVAELGVEAPDGVVAQFRPTVKDGAEIGDYVVMLAHDYSSGIRTTVLGKKVDVTYWMSVRAGEWSVRLGSQSHTLGTIPPTDASEVPYGPACTAIAKAIEGTAVKAHTTAPPSSRPAGPLVL